MHILPLGGGRQAVLDAARTARARLRAARARAGRAARAGLYAIFEKPVNIFSDDPRTVVPPARLGHLHDRQQQGVRIVRCARLSP